MDSRQQAKCHEECKYWYYHQVCHLFIDRSNVKYENNQTYRIQQKPNPNHLTNTMHQQVELWLVVPMQVLLVVDNLDNDILLHLMLLPHRL